MSQFRYPVVPVSRRKFLLAGGVLPTLACCASEITKLGKRPVGALAKDLDVCSAAYAVLRSGKPTTPVSVSGCSESSDPANAIYQAASLTKPIVAFAALRLVLEDELDLDAPASYYLPAGYKHFHSVLARSPSDPHDVVHANALAGLPIRTLLNHTSGLPNWTSEPLSFQFEPGQRWGYSGEGYVLLQSVIEAVTGKEFNAYFNEHVLAKLGMTDSSLVWRDEFAPRAVNGTAAFGRQRHIRFLEPVAAASLYTTAADYARFMSALLADDRLISLALSSPTMVDPALGLQWGLGWGIEHAEGGPYIWQWGNNPGFRAFAMASISSKDGFVILTDSERGMPLAASVANSVLPATHNAFRFPWVE